VEGIKTCTFAYCTLQNYVPIFVPLDYNTFKTIKIKDRIDLTRSCRSG